MNLFGSLSNKYGIILNLKKRGGGEECNEIIKKLNG